MARKEKDRVYYEITKEKPFGQFHLLLVGGAAGSVSGFLIASLVGAYEGVPMDTLVLCFLLASLLGFLLGAGAMWAFSRYFSGWVDEISQTRESRDEGPVENLETGLENAEPTEAAVPPVVEGEDSKGKSIDFMFPEFSPDKQ